MTNPYPNRALGYKMKPYLVNLLRSNGFQGNAEVAAAGIIGNLVVESGWFDPAVISGERRGDGGKAVGLAQWHPNRWSVVEQNVRNKGLDPYTWQGQLVGLVDEMLTTERRAWRELERATNEREATEAFLFFERPSGFKRENRGQGVPSYEQRVRGATVFSGDSPPPSDLTQFDLEPDETPTGLSQDQLIRTNELIEPSTIDLSTEDRDFLSVYGVLERSQRSTPKLIELENLILPGG